MSTSVREYAVLYVGKGGRTSGGSIGGGNAILNAGQHALDGPEHSAPADGTRLDASTDAHGLLPKLSGVPAERLDGEGAYRVVPAEEVVFTPAAGIAATDVQAAIQEVRDEAPGQPMGLTGAVAATRYVGGTTTGAPATGTFAVGDFVITQDGSVYICTVAGTPGTWVAVSGGGGGGSALTVEEVDGSPTDAAVTKFVFPNGTLGIVAHVATYTPPAVDVGIEASIGDGVSAMATGSKGFIEVPFACTITAARLVADVSGSVVVDVKTATYAGLPTTASICAAAKPTLAAAQKAEDTVLTGWTLPVAAGSWFEINVDSVTTIKRVTLSLTVRRT